MKLEHIGGAGKWKVVAPVTVVDGAEVCELSLELQRFEDDRQTMAAALGLHEVWKRIDVTGPRALGVSLYHQVDEKHGIYEFVKGRLRVLCFEASTGAICVCACIFVKKTQKTPKGHVSQAIALQKSYEKAAAERLIKIVRRNSKGELCED